MQALLFIVSFVLGLIPALVGSFGLGMLLSEGGNYDPLGELGGVLGFLIGFFFGLVFCLEHLKPFFMN